MREGRAQRVGKNEDREESNEGENEDGGKIQHVPWGFRLTFLWQLLSLCFNRNWQFSKFCGFFLCVFCFFFLPQETQIKLQGWGEGVLLSFHGNISDSMVASQSYLNQHVVNKIIGC